MAFLSFMIVTLLVLTVFLLIGIGIMALAFSDLYK